MSEPNDEERLSRKVIVEHSAGSRAGNVGITIGVIVVIAVALIIYIVMHMHR